MAEVRADLTFNDLISQANRQPGLSMSGLGGCQRRAAFNLLGASETDVQDKWAAMRGTALHTYILSARKQAHPELEVPEVDGTPCGPLNLPGLPLVPGTFDEYDPRDDTLTDYKTQEPDRVHWHLRNGPDLEHAFQTVGYAIARGAKHARIVYVPTSGTFDEWVVCELDVEAWMPRLVDWLAAVADGVESGADLPRGKPYDWCERFCPFFTACRGDDMRADLEEITDPQIVAAAEQYVQARAAESAAEKDKKAARTLLEGLRGRAGNVVISQQSRQNKPSLDAEQVTADYARTGAVPPYVTPPKSYALSVKAQ